jgi:hypothetical protein
MAWARFLFYQHMQNDHHSEPTPRVKQAAQRDRLLFEPNM